MVELHLNNEIIPIKENSLAKRLFNTYNHSEKRIPISKMEGVNKVLSEYDDGFYSLNYAEYNRICTELTYEETLESPLFSQEETIKLYNSFGGVPPRNPLKIKETDTSKIYLMKREGVHLFLYSGIVKDSQKFDKMYLLYGAMPYKLSKSGTSDEIVEYYWNTMLKYYHKVYSMFESKKDSICDSSVLLDNKTERQRTLIGAFFKYKWISTWNDTILNATNTGVIAI